jgi:HlyD family secretion protein
MANIGTPMRSPRDLHSASRDPEPADGKADASAPSAAIPARTHTAPASIFKRWRKPLSLAILAIGVLLYLLRDSLIGTPVETVPVVRGDLVQTIVASGRVATPQRVSVSAEATGRVAAVPVGEGQRVKRDQLLIKLTDDDERAALAQAEASISQNRAKLHQLDDVAFPAAEQVLKQAQSNLTQARQQFARTRALAAKGAFSQSQLDDAQRNLDVAQSQFQAAQIQVRTNQPGGSDYELAQTALQQALASRQAAQAKLDATRILAPVDGILIARDVERGDVAQAGKELMVLAPSGLTQVVVQIDEKNLGRLSVGQTAIGSADAFPDQRFAAKVAYINPGIDPLRGAVEVKLDVAKPPAYLRQDMTASIDIEVARRHATVIVPASTIRDLDNGKPWVMVVRQQRAQKQAVKPGLTGTGQVEVLEGVALGERLIPASNVAVAAGQRVRIADNGNRKQ